MQECPFQITMVSAVWIILTWVHFIGVIAARFVDLDPQFGIFGEWRDLYVEFLKIPNLQELGS